MSTITYIPRVFGGTIIIAVTGTPGIATITYLDPYSYGRAVSGIDTTQLISNLSRLKSAIGVGGTTLSLITPTTATLNEYDQIYLFDGAQSEILTINNTADVGATSLSIGPTLYAHSAGLAVCGDGSQGSLAQAIINASADLEAYCRQSLYQATYSNEELPLRSMQAAVTRNAQLVIRPKHFPVTAVSGVTLQMRGQTTVTLSTAYAQLDANGQVVTMTQMTSTSGSTTFWGAFAPPALPNTPGFVELSYTAGYTPAAMPSDIRQACMWLTSDLLSDRRNPTGAAELQQGKTHLVTRLRGDTSGESTLVLRAHARLDRYRVRPM